MLVNKFKVGGFSRKTNGPLNRVKLRKKLQYMESHGNDNAVNKGSGATGRYLITLLVLDAYNKKNKTNYSLDLMKDPNLNTQVRDWYMNDLESSTMANPTMSGDSIAYAKALGGFNWGRGNMSKYLSQAKARGIDIYDSWDWVPGLPPEPRNYINFILRGLDVNLHKNNADYQKFLEKYK